MARGKPSRTKDFLAASGVQLISAKGRPNQKLVEGWFNRLWTVLSWRCRVGMWGGSEVRWQPKIQPGNGVAMAFAIRGNTSRC